MRPSRPILVLLLGAGLLGCTEPSVPDPATTGAEEVPLEASTFDPASERLLTELDRLAASITAARDHLVEATEAPDRATGVDAAEAAIVQLIDAPELEVSGHDPDEPAVFPSTTTDRGEIEGADDLLTSLLTQARDAGGTTAGAVLDLLRDPLAGDLGAWQRDPAGMVAWAREQTAAGGSLDEMEAAVLELPGEGTRALAWATAAANADSTDELVAYAERGVAHLNVVLAAIDDVRAREAPDGAGAETDAEEGDT